MDSRKTTVAEIDRNSSSSVNEAGGSHSRSEPDLTNDISVNELDNIRLREITGKAVSGSLLLLLKWFKRSRRYPISMTLMYLANKSKTF